MGARNIANVMIQFHSQSFMFTEQLNRSSRFVTGCDMGRFTETLKGKYVVFHRPTSLVSPNQASAIPGVANMFAERRRMRK